MSQDNPLGEPIIRPFDPNELMQGFRAIWRTNENKPVIFRLVVFTVMMFSLPFVTFYFFHDYVLQDWSGDSRLTWSGLASVVCVNIIIFFYIIMAILEDDRTQPKAKEKRG